MTPLTAEQRTSVEAAARAFFEASILRQAEWAFDLRLDSLLAQDEPGVRAAVWAAYRAAAIHDAMKKDFADNLVRSREHVSPYTVKKVGKRPAGGWPLVVAMHGGGGAPKRVNDSQWQIMQRYYRDQADVEGYLYVALRAPNDSWNGFYADYVPPLLVRLIRQFAVLGDVDTGRVFLMGYSHGGYGAFFLGPKIPDRFAAVHASAAAPSDGAISPRTLRNTRFTFMIGEKDTMYGRLDRCKAFNAAVEKLRKDNPGEYPVQMELKEGFGHGGLPDRDKIKEMYPHRRDAVPRRLSWELTDGVVDRFYWLGVPVPAARQAIEARLGDNALTLTTSGVGVVEVGLDARLVKYDRPLRATIDGVEKEVRVVPSFGTLCRTMQERGDPELAWTCVVRLAGAKR